MSYRIFKKCFVVVLLSLFSSLLFVSCGEEKKSTSDQESAKNTKKEKILVDYKIVEPELVLTEDKKPYPLYVKFDGSVAKIEDFIENLVLRLQLVLQLTENGSGKEILL